MNFIVVGCGRVGSELAYRLFQRGHFVSVIDQSVNAFNNLPLDFSGRTIEGEALNQSVLQRAGIVTADGLAAVTNSDSLNAVVAYIAQIVFNVPNVVVRNYDPEYRSVFETLKLQVVSSSSWGAQRIEELLYQSEFQTVFSAGNGEVEGYEFLIPLKWHLQRLGELLPENGCVPVSLTRAGIASIPGYDTILQEGDILLVSATFEGIEAIRQRMKSQLKE